MHLKKKKTTENHLHPPRSRYWLRTEGVKRRWLILTSFKGRGAAGEDALGGTFLRSIASARQPRPSELRSSEHRPSVFQPSEHGTHRPGAPTRWRDGGYTFANDDLSGDSSGKSSILYEERRKNLLYGFNLALMFILEHLGSYEPFPPKNSDAYRRWNLTIIRGTKINIRNSEQKLYTQIPIVAFLSSVLYFCLAQNLNDNQISERTINHRLYRILEF